MPPFRLSASEGITLRVPLFPLNTVLFPGGLLPLRIFEQRYIAMIKSCIADNGAFGVCCITRGSEVLGATRDALPDFSLIGTLATIRSWDMPQLGILHVTSVGGTRFKVRTHRAQADGLIVAETIPIAPEPRFGLAESDRTLARLLEVLAARVGVERFPEERLFEDASWVGYRLAELLPLPLSIKQNMLEINDAKVRLAALQTFLRQHALI